MVLQKQFNLPEGLSGLERLVDEVTIPCGSGASTSPPRNQPLSCVPGFEPNSQIWAKNVCGNEVTMDQAVIPPHHTTTSHTMI